MDTPLSQFEAMLRTSAKTKDEYKKWLDDTIDEVTKAFNSKDSAAQIEARLQARAQALKRMSVSS